jgi:hypothetical protein
MRNLKLIVDSLGPLRHEWRLWQNSEIIAEGKSRSFRAARRAGTRVATDYLIAENCAGALDVKQRREGETCGRRVSSRDIVPPNVRKQWRADRKRRSRYSETNFLASSPVRVSVSSSGVVRVRGARKIIIR